METVFIDGSRGEGGGQILRTSLTLACITGKILRMENIRAARRKPGLAKQHLSCVRAACQICHGKCKGDTLGSQALDFQPGPIRSGDYSFDIGSAGSASLVVQTVLPALFLAGKPSTVTVTGGTHNPWAPPFDFLHESFLPAISMAGFQANCQLVKPGFFPAGGGKISFVIQPWSKENSKTIDLCESSNNAEVHARIYTSRLPEHVARKQKTLLRQSKLNIENIEHVEVTDSDGPGNCLMIRLVNSRTTLFTAFGMKRKPSRDVVNEAVTLTSDFLANEVPVDRYLADQLLIYMALSQAGQFTTNKLSTHLTTNIETIKAFLPVNFKAEHQNGVYKVSCGPV